MGQIVIIDKTSIMVYEPESPEISGWPEIIEGTKEDCLWNILSRKNSSLVLNTKLTETDLLHHALTLVAFTH